MDRVGSLSIYRIPVDGAGSVELERGQRISVKNSATGNNVLVRVRGAGYEVRGGLIVVQGVVRKCRVYIWTESTNYVKDSGERKGRRRKSGGEESKAFYLVILSLNFSLPGFQRWKALFIQ